MFDRNPRILMVVDNMRIGGMERQLVALLRGLRSNGHFRPALAILDPGGELESEAIRMAELFLPLRRRARFDISPGLLLAPMARAANVRLIHVFGWMSSLVGLVTARMLRIPVINGCIRGAPPRLRLRDHIKRKTALWSDAIVGNSLAGLQAYGVKENPGSRVIYNGLDLRWIEGLTAQPIGDKSICMVANFSFRKDQKTVIKAMATIHNAFPKAKLVLVGKDRGKLGENHRLVNEIGLNDCVRFITNTLWPAPYIAGCDVCVGATNVNSSGEGISNAILEYMALGKPVVATNCGGNAEVVREGETGLLVPGGKPEAIADRVIELLSKPVLAKNMGESGRQVVREKFSINRMIDEYEKLYDSLLSPHRNPSNH